MTSKCEDREALFGAAWTTNRPSKRFAAAAAVCLVVLVHLSAAIRGASAHLKTGFVPDLAVEVDLAVFDCLVTSLANRNGHVSPLQLLLRNCTDQHTSTDHVVAAPHAPKQEGDDRG